MFTLSPSVRTPQILSRDLSGKLGYLCEVRNGKLYTNRDLRGSDDKTRGRNIQPDTLETLVDVRSEVWTPNMDP